MRSQLFLCLLLCMCVCVQHCVWKLVETKWRPPLKQERTFSFFAVLMYKYINTYSVRYSLFEEDKKNIIQNELNTTWCLMIFMPCNICYISNSLYSILSCIICLFHSYTHQEWSKTKTKFEIPEIILKACSDSTICAIFFLFIRC